MLSALKIFGLIVYHVNKLCDKIESKEDICRMLPKFIETAIRSKAKVHNDAMKVSSSSGGGGGGDSSSPKKRKDPNGDLNSGLRPTIVRFDSPNEWCIPADLQYSKVFNRSMLSSIPRMTVDGTDRPFCNKLFTLRYCRNGNNCQFSHADPREHGKGPAMTAFYKKAFSEAKKTSS